MDYLEIVLNGFINNREYLDRYFIRKFKEAESQYYVLGEFFKGCLNVVSALNYDLKKKYYSDMKEYQECLHHAISINDKEAENHFREQLKEIAECNYSVNLYSFTGGKFTGHLFSEDIKYIALSLNDAFDKLQEQPPATSSEPEPPGAGENTEPINPYTRYFINGYHWQLFDEWRQELNKPDDFSFIYRVMWKDGFIFDDIGQKVFKTWIETTFSTGDLGKQLKTLSTCDSKAKYTIYQEKINKYQLHSKTLQKRSTNTTKM